MNLEGGIAMNTRISLKSIRTAADVETARAMARTAWFNADAKMHRLLQKRDKLRRPTGFNARVKVSQIYANNPALLDRKIFLIEEQVRKLRNLFDDDVEEIFNQKKELALA